MEAKKTRTVYCMAVLTIVPVVPWERAPAASPPINCQIFTMLFWRFNVWTFNVGLNLTTTTKKVGTFFLGGGRKVHAHKKCWLRVWEKSAALRWYGPRMVSLACRVISTLWVNFLLWRALQQKSCRPDFQLIVWNLFCYIAGSHTPGRTKRANTNRQNEQRWCSGYTVEMRNSCWPPDVFNHRWLWILRKFCTITERDA